MSVRTDLLGRPFLSFLVTRASMEISSAIILTTTSSSAGVGGILVYILRRWMKCSNDSSKSARASKLEVTPLAA